MSATGDPPESMYSDAEYQLGQLARELADVPQRRPASLKAFGSAFIPTLGSSTPNYLACLETFLSSVLSLSCCCFTLRQLVIASSVVLLLSSAAADASRSTALLFITFEACHESHGAVSWICVFDDEEGKQKKKKDEPYLLRFHSIQRVGSIIF